MKTDLLRLLFLASALRLAASTEPVPPPAEPAKAEPPAPAAEERPAPAAATRPTERLAADTAVFAAPDAKSAVVSRLKAGARVTPLPGEAPPGWRRVEVTGPFEAFAHTRDITKGLEVRAGANIRTAPRADAPVLTVATEEDKSDVVGLAGGDWAQIRIEKPLPGFIAVGETANQPAASDRPALAAPTRPAGSSRATAPGRPAQFAGNSADLPRTFQGQLTSAARPIFNPNPPYDYQLTDVNGKRIAYLDLRRVLLNVRLETLAGRSITVTGTLRNTVDGKDLVIAVETLTTK